MSAVKKLQLNDYNDMVSSNDADSLKLLNDSSYAPTALKNAVANMKALQMDYDPSDVAPERKAAFYSSKELKETAASMIPPMFPKGSEVSGPITREILFVRKKIAQMDFNPKAEEEVRDLINSLYLDQDTGVKKIESGHKVMDENWALYYARKLSNANNYADGSNRRPERDAFIKQSLLKNKDKYNQELLSTVLAKLDS